MKSVLRRTKTNKQTNTNTLPTFNCMYIYCFVYKFLKIS